MHGHSPGSALLVNAEVDSMGGVIDGGVCIDCITSPRRAAIEKAQAELRQEYDVREERRRELEFLEKGGNLLDFKFGPATSVSVQSTSLRDQLVTSEAKGSFALTASPHGDSVESSGRPGAPMGHESNSADNLLLFDGENDLLEGERNSVNPSRSNIAPSEQSSQLDGNHDAKESEDSIMFCLVVKSQAYARRNRSRSNRDSARVCSTDLVPVRDGNGSSTLPAARHGLRDGKGSLCEENTRKDHAVSSICKAKSTSSNGNVVLKTLASDNQLDMELDAAQVPGTVAALIKVGPPKGDSDVKASKDLRNSERNQHPQVDAQQISIAMDFMAPGSVEVTEGVSAGLECTPCAATAKVENQITFDQLIGFKNINRDEKAMQNEGQNTTAVFSTKGLDSDFSCTRISLSLDGNNANDQCPNLRNVNSNGNTKEQALEFEGTFSIAGANMIKEKSEMKPVDAVSTIKDHNYVHQNHNNNGSQDKFEEGIIDSRSGLQNEVKFLTNIEKMDPNDHSVSKAERKPGDLLGDNSNSKRASFCSGRPYTTMDFSNCELPEATFSGRHSTASPELQTLAGNQLKLVNKAHEDSILEEARIIEAKRKRIAELSVGTLLLENRRKTHWDFVLEEMAWLANDFMQERVWKTTGAAQICNQVAFTGRLRFDEKNLHLKQRKVAHTLAKAIMQFWHSTEVLLNSDDPSVGLINCESDLVGSRITNGSEAIENRIAETNKGTSELLEEYPRKSLPLAVQGYAVRFFKYNRSLDCPVQAEAPMTADRISDWGILEMSQEDQFSESFFSWQENLFYTVPAGAMETYRKSVESHFVQYEKTGSNTQEEEVDTSIYEAVTEFGSREIAYEEDEGEMSRYHLPGAFEGSSSSKFAQKKRKNLPKSYTARSYELGADLPFGHCMENKLGTQQSLLVGKRPANSLNVGSIPTKRVRTAARQRVVSPFSAGATGGVQFATKTDVSSGDASSFQDDQSTLYGGSQIGKNLEVESTGDFGKQLPFDCTEMTTQHKKKKAKHLGSAYEQRWQLDSMVPNEQRDHSKKRLNSHPFDSNGSSGLYGQHPAKKQKIMKQSLDTSPESITPVTRSIPSPVASQMSNMSNPNKLIKMIAGRDRRKTKALKISAGQSGSGILWSLFEDQALVVLVHDMGPNWELVSDAMNSTLRFKCIFRKPKECKERHKTLMDRNAGDGADSAEDSGSSQPYPSTLPGIPKGSARQLFQRLQGPMEEDTIKSHFEKIILIGHQEHSRRSQNDNQDMKQVAPVHNSHVLSLSQACPNNLNGGFLTPLDLCDATTSSPDVLSLGVSHTSGLAISNQGSLQPVLSPIPGANSMLQGSSGIVHGSSLPSPSAAVNASTRYGVPRPGSLPIDEKQRLQQLNQMLTGRSIQQSNLSVRGVRMLPGGNGMGMMCGMNRGMPMPRPGFQGVASPAMLNSGSMLPSTGVGMPSPVNVYSGAVSGQGNSMLRPREALHRMRNPEDQRQMMIPELQMQVTQGNSQGVPPFNGLSTAFSNQTVPPPVQTYPVHHHQQHQVPSQQSQVLSNPHHPHIQSTNHATSPQQQAYALRLAKDRQLQHRLLQQQQHHFATTEALMPHVQPQSQHPISSLQNGSQIQQQASSQPLTLPPPNSQHPLTQSSSLVTPISSQHQQKHHLPLHGLDRNPQVGSGSPTNQMLKQRQRPQQQQQLQHPGRHHPQQRHQQQSQQQAKLTKGLGRGNMVIHQNLSIDPSHVNGLSTTPGNQVAEKVEEVMHLMQGQGLYSGSGSNPIQPGKPLAPPQSSNQCPPQQKLFSRPLPPSSKQLQQMPSHSENSNQGQVPSVPSGHTLLASQQPIPPLPAMASSHHQQQQPQPHQRQLSQSHQTIQKMLQQNRQINSDLTPFTVDQVQVNSHPVSNAFHMGTSMAMPQSCTESTSVIPIVSSASAPPQWKMPEPLYDSGMPNPATHLAAMGNPPLLNSAGAEPMPSPSQGSGQRQFSGSMHPHGHNVGAQWQQQQPPPHPQQQQQRQPPPQQQQRPQQQQSQPQQHLQTAPGSLYARPTNSGPE